MSHLLLAPPRDRLMLEALLVSAGALTAMTAVFHALRPLKPRSPFLG